MRLLLLIIIALCVLPLCAQETITLSSSPVLLMADSVAAIPVAGTTEKKSDKQFLSHLSIALRASTMGIGLQAATPINDYFKLRAGIDFVGFKTSTFDIGLDDPDGMFKEAFGYTPDYKMKGELNFTNGNILVDFHPTKGIFHLTAGVFIGANKLKASGFLANPNTGERATLKPGVSEWPYVDFDGHRLTLDDANLDAILQLGKIIKPYFGLGVGRAIANKRVAFKFELGMIYQGDYSLEQNGKKLDVESNASESFEDIDDYTKWLKWWPMLNFQLSYKIF